MICGQQTALLGLVPPMGRIIAHLAHLICHQTNFFKVRFPSMFQQEDSPLAQQLVHRCCRLWVQASKAIQLANSCYTDQYPSGTDVPCDKVCLCTRNLHLRTPFKKLTPHFIGPYRITHRINPVTYRLKLPPSLRIYLRFLPQNIHYISSPAPCSQPSSPPHHRWWPLYTV